MVHFSSFFRSNPTGLIRDTRALLIGAGFVLAILNPFRAQCAPRPQAAPSTWDGIYTSEQAKRGEGLFQGECSKCHGQQLEGLAEAPSLAGGEFLSKWNGLTVGDLYERIRKTMPMDNPGKLSGQQYADILAFLLKANEFPAGERQVGTQAEMLKQFEIVQFDPRPQPAPAPGAANAENGKQFFSSAGCAECHGTSAKGGTAPQVASPKMALPEFIKGMRHPAGKMPSVDQEKASDAQLADIYAFLQTIKPDPSTAAPHVNPDSQKK